MKHWLAAVAIVSASVVALGLYQSNRLKFVVGAAAQNAPQPGTAQMLPEINNEAVLVLRIRLAPHERTGMHDVTARLVVWLTDAHIRDTKPDGTTSDYRRTAGAVEWVEPQRHAGENLSDSPIEFLAIIPKSAPSVGSRTGTEHGERH
jgi:hypothetical protein